METIRIYIDNMFSRLPQTQELLGLKVDMLRTMEDKYEELKSMGTSENEAIGIVISEFGNIDELVEELGLNTGNNASSYLSSAEAHQYMYDTIKYSRMAAIGTALLFPGSIFLALFLAALLPSGVSNVSIFQFSLRSLLGMDKSHPGFSILSVLLILFPLLLEIALSLVLLLYGNSMLSQYRYLEITPTVISASLAEELHDRLAAGRLKHTLRLLLAWALTLFSVLCLIFALNQSSYIRLVILLLLGLAILIPAAALFLSSGAEGKACRILLKSSDLSQENGKSHIHRSRSPFWTVVTRPITWLLSFLLSSYWPLVTVFYFVISFRYFNWHISWIIWVLAPTVRALLHSILNAIEGIKDGSSEENPKHA